MNVNDVFNKHTEINEEIIQNIKKEISSSKKDINNEIIKLFNKIFPDNKSQIKLINITFNTLMQCCQEKQDEYKKKISDIFSNEMNTNLNMKPKIVKKYFDNIFKIFNSYLKDACYDNYHLYVNLSDKLDSFIDDIWTETSDKYFNTNLIKLQNSETYFKTIFENSKTAITILDISKLKLIKYNDSFIKLFGKKRIKELTKLNATNSINPKDLSPKYQKDGQLSSVKLKKMINITIKKKYNNFNWIHEKYNGEKFDSNVSFSLINLKNKNNLIQIIIRDISEDIKKTEEILKFKTITDIANYGFVMATIKGKITYTNDYFAKMHGYKKKYLIGKNLSILHNKKQMKLVSKLNRELLTKGNYSNETVGHITKDNSIIITLMNGSILKEDGKPKYFTATALNITKYKKLENKSKYQYKQMEFLSNFSMIIEKNKNIKNIFNELVKIIPMAFDSSKSLIFKIIFKDYSFISKNYKELDSLKNFNFICTNKNHDHYNAKKPLGFLKIGYLDGSKLLIDDLKLLKLLIERLNKIFERLYSEEMLIENTKKDNNIINNIQDGIVVINKKTQIIACNNALNKIFEVRKGETMVGTSIFKYTDILTKARIIKDLLILSKKPGNLRQYNFKTTLGNKIIIQTIGNNIIWNGEKAFLISVRNITNSVNLNSKINNLKEIYKNVLDNLDEGVVLLDENKKLIIANYLAYKMMGMKNKSNTKNKMKFANNKNKLKGFKMLGNSLFNKEVIDTIDFKINNKIKSFLVKIKKIMIKEKQGYFIGAQLINNEKEIIKFKNILDSTALIDFKGNIIKRNNSFKNLFKIEKKNILNFISNPITKLKFFKYLVDIKRNKNNYLLEIKLKIKNDKKKLKLLGRKITVNKKTRILLTIFE